MIETCHIFENDTLWEVLVSIWLLRTNYLLKGVVSITSVIMVSIVFWNPWSQLTSQNVFRSSASPLCSNRLKFKMPNAKIEVSALNFSCWLAVFGLYIVFYLQKLDWVTHARYCQFLQVFVFILKVLKKAKTSTIYYFTQGAKGWKTPIFYIYWSRW